MEKRIQFVQPLLYGIVGNVNRSCDMSLVSLTSRLKYIGLSFLLDRLSSCSSLSNILVNVQERYKWEMSVPGGIIPAEGGEMNSTSISPLYHR